MPQKHMNARARRWGARYRQASADDYSAVLHQKCKFNLKARVHSMNGDKKKIQMRLFFVIFTNVTLNI